MRGTWKCLVASAEGRRRAAGTGSPPAGRPVPAIRLLPAPSPRSRQSLREERGAQRRAAGRDSKRPTESQPCPAAELMPQADPRANRRATEESGFGRGRQTTVRNGGHRTRRPRRHPSWRKGGVLVLSSPLHHR